MNFLNTGRTSVKLSLLAAAFVLSGCDHAVNRWNENALGPFQQQPEIKVAPKALNTHLKVDGQGALTAESFANLNAVLKAQGPLKRQQILISTLTPAGQKMALRLQATLLNAGLPAHQVRVVDQADAKASNAQGWDLQLLSQALVVDIPDCAIADAESWTVHPYKAVGPLGCSTRANLAAMVSDPRDLMRAKALDGANGRAAENAVKRYTENEVTELLDIDFNED